MTRYIIHLHLHTHTHLEDARRHLDAFLRNEPAATSCRILTLNKERHDSFYAVYKSASACQISKETYHISKKTYE
jgi:hypothetical protein